MTDLTLALDRMNRNHWTFIETHLERVSRSFSFCIAELRAPFRDQVGLSYLLFRLLDTIEDVPGASVAEKTSRFQDFFSLLKDPSSRNRFVKDSWTSWLTRSGATANEILLFKDFSEIHCLYHQLSPSQREPILSTLETMGHGMLRFLRSPPKTLHENSEYCYYVAGIIGPLLSQLFSQDRQLLNWMESQRETSVEFGLFLQRVNILKDYDQDLQEGRNFTESWDTLRQTVTQHVPNVQKYLLSIPREHDDYRVFCAWSFLLGLASLPYIDASHRDGKAQKISRIKAFAICQQIKNNIRDDQWLETYALGLQHECGISISL